MYYPRDENSDSDEFIEVNLLVATDAFEEITKYLSTIKDFSLRFMGTDVTLDWDGEPAWMPMAQEQQRDRSLYVLGFSYAAQQFELPERSEEAEGLRNL